MLQLGGQLSTEGWMSRILNVGIRMIRMDIRAEASTTPVRHLLRLLLYGSQNNRNNTDFRGGSSQKKPHLLWNCRLLLACSFGLMLEVS